jgi:hypothetical protein
VIAALNPYCLYTDRVLKIQYLIPSRIPNTCLLSNTVLRGYKYCTTRPYMILHYKINEWYTRYIAYSTLQDTYIILHYTIHTWYWTVQIRTLYWTVRSIGAWIGLWRREENAFEMANNLLSGFWSHIADCSREQILSEKSEIQ